jgi:hypothetical protein
MGDLCRWLNEHGDDCWIVAGGIDNIGLTILTGQCGLPMDRIRIMPAGDRLEDFIIDQITRLEIDLVDHQWWGAGIPDHGWPVPTIATIHGRVPLPPPSFYRGILSVETLVEHRHLRARARFYREVWNWVDLERFAFQPELGEDACFLGRSFKLVNAIKVAKHWEGSIDCYGIATTELLDMGNHLRWKGFADPAEFLPRYRVVFASAMCALEAMAVGRSVIAGQDFQETVPAGELITPENVAQLAKWQFYTNGNSQCEVPSDEVYRTFMRAMREERLQERIDLREWVEDHHSIDGQIGKIQDFYREVLE